MAKPSEVVRHEQDYRIHHEAGASVNREYVASWRGRPVYVLRGERGQEAIPDDVAANLQHVMALNYKIQRLSENLRDAVDVLASSVARWDVSDARQALRVCEMLTEQQVPGRGAVRSSLKPFVNMGHRINHCVYVLLYNAEVVYVGRSAGKQSERVKQHDKNGKIFDEVVLYECRDRKHMFDLEAVLIDQHRPRYNQRLEVRVPGEAS